MTNQSAGSAPGVIATLKVLAILSVIAMALLGIFVVFDAVSIDDAGPVAGKIAMLMAILAGAGGTIGLLSKSSRR